MEKQKKDSIVIDLHGTTPHEQVQEQLTFISDALRGQEWTVTIRAEAGDKTALYRLTEIEDRMLRRKLATNIVTDKNGVHSLQITNFGPDSKISDVSKMLGMGSAIKYTFQNLGTKLAVPAKKIAALGKFWTENKAKLIGLTYLAGDLTIGSTAWQKDKDKDKEKDPFIKRFKDAFTNEKKIPGTLRSIYGYLGATQSLIFMNFAFEADQQLARNLKRQIKAARKAGADLSDVKSWTDTPPKVNPLSRFLERNAITVGSITQIIGRLFWLKAGLLDRDKNDDNIKKAGLQNETWDVRRKEFDAGKFQGDERSKWFERLKWHSEASSGKSKIKDSLLSILGWVLIMIKEKPASEQGKGNYIMDSLRKHSNRLASFANAFSTYYGLKSAKQKIGMKAQDDMTEEEKKDIEEGRRVGDVELAGNVVYLTGDGTVFLTNTMDYDEKSATSPAKLAKVGVEVLKQIPVVMGNEKKNDVLIEIANYLAEHSEALNSGKDCAGKDPETRARIAAHAKNIRSEMINLMPDPTHLLEEVAATASSIPGQFPEGTQQQVAKQLAATLSNLSAIEAPAEEIHALINEYMEHKQLKPLNNTAARQTANEAFVDLINMIPGENKVSTAAALYNAINPLMASTINKEDAPGEKAVTETPSKKTQVVKTVPRKEDTTSWQESLSGMPAMVAEPAI